MMLNGVNTLEKYAFEKKNTFVKYTFEKYTFEKYTFKKYTFDAIHGKDSGGMG